MTDAEEALRAGLRDPALDEGISAPALLAGVRSRQQRLLRRRQHAKTLAAAAAAVLVVGGAAVVTARAPHAAPAQQPTPVAPAPTAPAAPPVSPTAVPPAPPTAVSPPVSTVMRTPAAVPTPSRGPNGSATQAPLPEPPLTGDPRPETRAPALPTQRGAPSAEEPTHP
jgi:hypothetical protein